MRSTQLSFETIPKNQASYNLGQSKACQEMVEVGGRVCQLLGLPRSTGQIFGLLYLSAEPLTLNQMSMKLSISKGSVSVGTRQLASFGAINKVWIPGDRRDFYEVIEDLGQLIRGSYNSLINPRIQTSKDRIASMHKCLLENIRSGNIQSSNKEILENRIKHLEVMHSRIIRFFPIMEKMFG